MSQNALALDSLEGRGRTLLMFAYHFPPCNCWPTASERAIGLARGLVAADWKPIILTRELPINGCRCGARRDDGTASERTERFQVIRVPATTWRSTRGSRVLARVTVLITGARDGWSSNARKMALRQLDHNDVDLVWTTTAPIVSLRLGHFFQRKWSVPWVAELRDSEWRRSVMVVKGNGMKSRLLRRRAKLLARPLRRADAVVHVSPGEARADRDLIGGPTEVIPSGFDEVAWARIHASSGATERDAHVLTVLLAGHVYPDQPGYSTFFEGANRYAASPCGETRPLRVAYLGSSFEAFRSHAKRFGIADAVADGGVVSLEGARHAMVGADALLLVHSAKGYSSPGGKFYEYLASCRPILAVPGTDEFVADILQRTGHGLCLPDAESVRLALTQLARGSWSEPAWPSAGLQEFMWAARSRQLADVFTSCLATQASGRLS